MKRIWLRRILTATLSSASFAFTFCLAHADVSEPVKRSSYVPPVQELSKKLGPAVVKVVVKHFGVPIAFGSGFFVAGDGSLVTHQSLVRPALADASNTIEFVTFDKKTITDYKFLSCGQTKFGVTVGELCLLKMNPEPKSMYSLIPTIPFAQIRPAVGDGASVFGHPRGLDFSITRGQISKLAGLQLNAPVGPGNTGGPVFDDQGRLWGVAGKFAADRTGFTDVIPASEIQSLLDLKLVAVPIADARKASQEKMRSEIHKQAADDLEQALGFAARAKSLAELKGYKEVALKFDDRTLRLTLPDIFDDCAFTQKTRESTLHACYGMNEAAVLSVQRFPGKGYEDLLARNGKTLMEARQLTVVEELVHNDDWSLYEQMLTPSQKRAFTSSPSLAQCQVVRTSSLRDAAFSDIQACRFSVSNDTDPGGYSINVWLLKDQYLYAVAMWMNDSLMSEYFSRVASLAVMTSHWEKRSGATNVRGLASELKTTPLPSYKIALPETVSFEGAKSDSKDSQVDLYGKKLLMDRFEDSYKVAITNQQRPYLPPDFDDVTRHNAGEVAKLLGAKIQSSTNEIEATKIGDRPGRIYTAFGKDAKGRDVLVISGAIFFDDQTFEITQVAVTKDPPETFKEFKNLLSGFKRK